MTFIKVGKNAMVASHQITELSASFNDKEGVVLRIDTIGGGESFVFGRDDIYTFLNEMWNAGYRIDPHTLFVGLPL
jgi:hypothetical protein